MAASVTLYLVRVSPSCRVVWLYLLQVNMRDSMVVDITHHDLLNMTAWQWFLLFEKKNRKLVCLSALFFEIEILGICAAFHFHFYVRCHCSQFRVPFIAWWVLLYPQATTSAGWSGAPMLNFWILVTHLFYLQHTCWLGGSCNNTSRMLLCVFDESPTPSLTFQ